MFLRESCIGLNSETMMRRKNIGHHHFVYSQHNSQPVRSRVSLPPRKHNMWTSLAQAVSLTTTTNTLENNAYIATGRGRKK
jgi:hypothetical protein